MTPYPAANIAAFLAEHRDTLLGAGPLGWAGAALLLWFLVTTRGRYFVSRTNDMLGACQR